MDSLPDDEDHSSETPAERVARYWKNAATAFDKASTAETAGVRYHYRQIAIMWGALAEDAERKPVPVVRDGHGQRARH